MCNIVDILLTAIYVCWIYMLLADQTYCIFSTRIIWIKSTGQENQMMAAKLGKTKMESENTGLAEHSFKFKFKL